MGGDAQYVLGESGHDEGMPETTHTETPCDEFVARFAPAYGDDWTSLVRDLAEDEDEGVLVAELRSILRKGESFREAVRVDLDEAVVSNGCHRVVASILEGAPVRWAEDSGDDFFDDNELDVEIVVEGFLDADFFDQLTGRLRSFALDDELWVETCGFGARRIDAVPDLTIDVVAGAKPKPSSQLSGVWCCPEARADELVTALTTRVSGLGRTVRSIRWRRFNPDVDELEPTKT